MAAAYSSGVPYPYRSHQFTPVIVLAFSLATGLEKLPTPALKSAHWRSARAASYTPSIYTNTLVKPSITS